MKNYLKAGFIAVSVVASTAFAAIPADVTTALSTAQTDGVSVAGTVLAVVVAIAAFKYIRRAL